MKLGPYIIALCLFASISSVWMRKKKKTSKPCASLQTDYGYVCVCNSTYCDTIEAPTKHKRKYYHYSTSETSPGFNLKKGKFGKRDSSLYDDTSDVYITVDSSTTYQSFKGLGVGFSDSAAYVYSQLSTKAQENLLASYFGPTGIKLSFGRVPLGDTDFCLSYYSYDDTVDDVNMTNFALPTFETETRMPLISSALAASGGTLKLLATPWSSPTWMKDNNATAPGFLIPSYQEAFTRYIIKFLDAHNKSGIEYWGLSPMNEVVFGTLMGFNMPNIMMLPVQLRSWIRDYLGPMMEDAGYGDVQLLMLDDERPFLAWYGETLLTDNETAQYIDGFAVHWYSDTDTNTGMADDFHNAYPDVYLILTEASGVDVSSSSVSRRSSHFGEPGPNPTGGGGGGGGGGGTSMEIGSWATGLEYVANILQNFQHWSVGYMAWNMFLNPDGGPYMQMSQESPIIVNTTSDEFYKQPFYYGLGHFSKFLYPDSVRIGLTIESSGATTVAYSDLQKEKTKTTTATTTTTHNPQPSGGAHSGGPGPNPTGGSFTGGFPTGGFPTGGGGGGGGGGLPTKATLTTFDGVASTNPDGSTTVILVNPNSDVATVVITDTIQHHTITTTVEPNSINTFVYW